jgi:hypothetical protein
MLGHQLHAVLSGTIAPGQSLVIASQAGAPMWNTTSTDPAALYQRDGVQTGYRTQEQRTRRRHGGGSWNPSFSALVARPAWAHRQLPARCRPDWAPYGAACVLLTWAEAACDTAGEGTRITPECGHDPPPQSLQHGSTLMVPKLELLASHLGMGQKATSQLVRDLHTHTGTAWSHEALSALLLPHSGSFPFARVLGQQWESIPHNEEVREERRRSWLMVP